jgi:hypothetical protein
VVFDGSYHYRPEDRFSEVYGNTTVGFGELVLQGNVVYGAADNIGSFTLDKWATISSDTTTNRIQANRITINGTVDIASGGTLELAAVGGVEINGTLSFGLMSLTAPDLFAEIMASAFEASSSSSTTGLSVVGDLSFGKNAVLNFYWDDDLELLHDGWSNEYNLFDFISTVGGDLLGLENLTLDFSGFAPDGTVVGSVDWTSGVLSLSYDASSLGDSSAPEPATLAIIGLGLAGLGLARRRRR